MSGFVLDASVTLVWLFDDENHPQAEAALRALEIAGAVVPSLWHSEIRNALLVAQRRNRLTVEDARERLKALSDLPIQTDNTPDLDKAFDLAQKHTLSFYDALYLELAVRLRLPLASLDKRLIEAATSTSSEGLPLW